MSYCNPQSVVVWPYFFIIFNKLRVIKKEKITRIEKLPLNKHWLICRHTINTIHHRPYPSSIQSTFIYCEHESQKQWLGIGYDDALCLQY